LPTILVAPTAFKGTLTPIEVARAIESGIRQACPDSVRVIIAPIADGGDGTIESVQAIIGGELRTDTVLGPTGQPVPSSWLKFGKCALVELASSCGLALLPEGKLAPMEAHTYGLGQAIARCHEAGCTEINIALGGSASTDGGTGALRALGATFFRDDGDEVVLLGGQSLASIVDFDPTCLRWLVKDTVIRVLTDVDNPLTGPYGAATIFGPQKGASADQIAVLEQGLEQLAEVLERITDRQMRNVPGAGSAGGTAFGLACALGAEITSGFDWVAGAIGLDGNIAAADLVITGEGCFDAQSLKGKAVGKLLKRCAQAQKPVCIVSAQDGMGLTHGDHWVVNPQLPASGRCGSEQIAAVIKQAVPQFFHD